METQHSQRDDSESERGSDLYIILHKVRGEPAFDIAQPIQIGDEVSWIIPTSGHRAHPVARWPLSDFLGNNTGDEYRELLATVDDHYMASATPGTGTISDLFSKLGFQRSAQPQVKRRI